jgi:hypothetical protein
VNGGKIMLLFVLPVDFFPGFGLIFQDNSIFFIPIRPFTLSLSNGYSINTAQEIWWVWNL